MLASVILCILALLLTAVVVRRKQPSLGLPVAYLYLLLLIHIPGAVGHLLPDSRLPHRDFTEVGIRCTAIGCWSFVAGLWLARIGKGRQTMIWRHPGWRFLLFCLLGGWAVTFGLRPLLVAIPSIGAAIDKGGMIWVLGILIGLATSWQSRDYFGLFVWGVAMLVYPVVGLVNLGFLSFGTNAVVVCCSLLVVATRSLWVVSVGTATASLVGLSLFVSYFTIRDEIRDVVWGGGTLNERLAVSFPIFKDYQWLDAEDIEHRTAIDKRLNQNIFVGMATARLHRGTVDYYQGRTVWEGLLSLVPRTIWPNKTVYGGSPKIIKEMTGIEVTSHTSWGVGNVMEFYINFGIPSLVAGFVLFGLLLGTLDRLAATALVQGDYTRLIFFALPAFVLIQPGKSTVEMIGGAAAAAVAALGWSWAWSSVDPMRRMPVRTPRTGNSIRRSITEDSR